MPRPGIYPILLAAGPSPRLGFPAGLASFAGRSALKIAVDNCAGLRPPVVVLGWHANRLRAQVPPGCRVVVNRKWSSGQLSSLRAGLRGVPAGAAVMIYPVDLVLLKPRVIGRLVRAYQARRKGQEIVMPRFRGRGGHPVILSPRVLPELAFAQTAREVVYRDIRRLLYVSVRTPAIWKDFSSPVQYSRLRRELRS